MDAEWQEQKRSTRSVSALHRAKGPQFYRIEAAQLAKDRYRGEVVLPYVLRTGGLSTKVLGLV